VLVYDKKIINMVFQINL